MRFWFFLIAGFIMSTVSFFNGDRLTALAGIICVVAAAIIAEIQELKK